MRVAPLYWRSDTHTHTHTHGANDGKYTTGAKPGIDLGSGNKASAANNLNAKQPAIEIDSTDDDASSDKESEEGSDDVSSSDETSASTSSDEEEQSNGPAGRRWSAPGPPLCHGGGNANRDVTWQV